MAKHVLMIQAHPDPARGHFGHALSESYLTGAVRGGHETRELRIADLDFSLIESQAQWKDGEVPEAIRRAQSDIEWADHLVFVYPLWLGDMPAKLKGFLEQVLRPGFAFGSKDEAVGMGQGRLRGKSARIVVTMGMPGFFYRLFYRAHSLKVFKRNILEFCGVKPVRSTVIGLVEGKQAQREKSLEQLESLGARAA